MQLLNFQTITLCADEAAFHLQIGPVSPCTAWSVSIGDQFCTVCMYVKSNLAMNSSLCRLRKPRRLGPMCTVGLPKLFPITATVVSQWTLSEMDYFAVGKHLTSLPTGVQLWVQRPIMQLNWWSFWRSGWILNQLCKWTKLSSGLTRDVQYRYHPWHWGERADVHDVYLKTFVVCSYLHTPRKQWALCSFFRVCWISSNPYVTVGFFSGHRTWSE